MKERFEERSARALPFFPLILCTEVQYNNTMHLWRPLSLSHTVVLHNVSPPFHDQVFCSVVAAKWFMPLSSVVHALISLSAI